MSCTRKQYSKAEQWAMFSAAAPVRGMNPKEYRQDAAGRVMQFSKYGNRHALHGWEAGHQVDCQYGGSSNVKSGNMKAENWRTNNEKNGGEQYNY